MGVMGVERVSSDKGGRGRKRSVKSQSKLFFARKREKNVDSAYIVYNGYFSGKSMES